MAYWAEVLTLEYRAKYVVQVNSLWSHKQLIGYIVALIICAAIPLFVSSPYYLDLFIITIVNAALGIAFILTLRTGLMNLGLAAFWGIGAYSSAVLTAKFNLSFWLSLPASVLITVIIAFLVGYFLIRSGGGGFGFVMLSSVIGMLFSVVVGSINYLGGYSGIPDIPIPNPINLPFLPAIEFVSKIPFYYLALVLLIVVILICKSFYLGWAGRAWNAIGLNSRLAESLGINVFRYKLLSFVISSALAGLIGCFYAQYEGFVIPDTFSMWVNVYIQIYAILGGLGYGIWGPLVGSTAYTYLLDITRSKEAFTPVFLGSLLIVLILFLPQGILGLTQWRTPVLERMAKLKLIFSSNHNRKG
jgi:branched-chain amino acid transport system permease protein